MASRVLPNLALNGFWNLGEDGWKDGADANWLKLSTLVMPRVLSKVTALPGSPIDGMVYIVPTGGDANKIAVRDNDAWVYYTPLTGWLVWIDDVSGHYKFTGSAWVALVAGGALTAADVEYIPADTTQADNVQDAIEQLYAAVGGGGSVDASGVTYDGGTGGPADVEEALDDLFSALGDIQDLGTPLDPAFFFAGGTGDEDRRVTYVATRPFDLPTSLTGSQTYAGTAAAATAGVTFTLQKNGSPIGTVAFAAAASTATFTFASPVSFAVGDRLSVLAPADLDTIEEVSITLKGTRTA